ncbi:uncharacterized protein BDCG_07758 [Blastomyces dermatitidis ER-3]|uniref:Uncharacterized protein n=1 Tax=Ajellomyces dermatitidis (strain ER-3 / ATCC MYA-2586) TaxID=559297 RepID=A0ABP2F6B2_AJEDR|nr:uncharacterized protein BDCG_07758 [Blastomyces dermatitidis ER-3]EEQ92638.1 hypothetical protein BDCG_07758 [Blastomyces dermatitidis ER-3]
MATATTAVTASAPHLSANDSAVLQALFDAESSLSNASTGIHLDSSLPQQLPGISPAELSKLQALERAAILPLQAETTGRDTIRDANKIRAAVAKLTAIIEENKGYASAYVNRAQAARMLVESGMDGKEKDEEEQRELANMIFADLSTVISLLSPSPSSSSSSPSLSSASQHPSPLSPLHARILANAHTHRAYIVYRAARALDSKPPPPSMNNNNNNNDNTTSGTATLTTLPVHLRDKSAQHLEEMASMDFQLGGRYGNEIARQMAVKTNPYAKMCGAIVKEAMRKEMMVHRGEGEGEGEGEGFVV